MCGGWGERGFKHLTLGVGRVQGAVGNLPVHVHGRPVAPLVVLLEKGVPAEDGFLPVALRGGDVVAGEAGVGVDDFLGTLRGSGGGVFGLVGAALTLRGGESGGGIVVVSVCGSGRGLLAGTAFLGRLGAGSRFGVGVAAVHFSGFELDGGLATLLGRGFGGSGFAVVVVVVVVIVGVAVGRCGFGSAFLGSGGFGGTIDGGAGQELFLQHVPGGVGRFAAGEAGYLGELFGVDLGRVVSFSALSTKVKCLSCEG